METDEEMSKTLGMWIKIKRAMAERFPQRSTDKGLKYVLRYDPSGATKRKHPTSLIVI